MAFRYLALHNDMDQAGDQDHGDCQEADRGHHTAATAPILTLPLLVYRCAAADLLCGDFLDPLIAHVAELPDPRDRSSAVGAFVGGIRGHPGSPS